MTLIVGILFINVNPYISGKPDKQELLSYIPAEYTPKYILYNKSETDLRQLSYPLIFKPCVCSGNSKDVAVIRDEKMAREYIDSIKNKDTILIQEYIPYKNEIGLLFEKNILNGNNSNNKQGSIISMVQKSSTTSDIMAGCNNNNTKCTDITEMKSKKLEDLFNKIQMGIPNLNVARYDIKFKDIDSLLAGKDFYILEVNGVFGFDLNKRTIVKRIINIERWFLIRLLWGFKNIITVNGYTLVDLVKEIFSLSYKLLIKCI